MTRPVLIISITSIDTLYDVFDIAEDGQDYLLLFINQTKQLET